LEPNKKIEIFVMYMKIFRTIIMSQNVIACGFKKVRNK